MTEPRGFRDRADDSIFTLVGDVPELIRNLVIAEVDAAKAWLRKTSKDAGIGSGWIVNWRAEPPVTFQHAVDADVTRAEAFRRHLLDAGVLQPPYPLTDNRICVAFDDDIDQTVEAARRAFAAVS